VSLKMRKTARAVLLARLDGSIYSLRWEWEQNRLRNIYWAGLTAVDGAVCPYPARTEEWGRWREGRQDARHSKYVAESRHGLGYMQGRGAS
jgi:hypothetical protein